jgi:hypothetical protein
MNNHNRSSVGGTKLNNCVILGMERKKAAKMDIKGPTVILQELDPVR